MKIIHVPLVGHWDIRVGASGLPRDTRTLTIKYFCVAHEFGDGEVVVRCRGGPTLKFEWRGLRRHRKGAILKLMNQFL